MVRPSSARASMITKLLTSAPLLLVAALAMASLGCLADQVQSRPGVPQIACASASGQPRIRSPSAGLHGRPRITAAWALASSHFLAVEF